MTLALPSEPLICLEMGHENGSVQMIMTEQERNGVVYDLMNPNPERDGG